MSWNRRQFLQASTVAAGAAALSPHLAPGAVPGAAARVVTLLHTNDTHSRLEPFERGALQGLGGIARRAHLIKRIRRSQPATLVLDAGDIFQGTPYFNEFGGAAEFETMTAAGYDLATLGNHDFDNGVDGLVKALPSAGFEFVSANLDIDPPEMRKRVKPFTVRVVGGRRIGLFGLGVRFRGLVPKALHRGVRYREPVAAARAAVDKLRSAHGAEAIVALSHLGYFGYNGEPGDVDIAEAVQGIDVIIGGHSHTLLDQPHIVEKRNGQRTAVVQVGYAGTHLGRVDLRFSALVVGGREVAWAAALPVTA